MKIRNNLNTDSLWGSQIKVTFNTEKGIIELV
jgi:hypothetical protein